MTKSHFRIVPLSSEIAAAARQRATAGAPDHAIVEVDSEKSVPCRHCLRWAQPGERVILFPYASIAAGRPYSESGPIFVHAAECPRYRETERYPDDFRRHRVIRAYDSDDFMIDAIVVDEEEPEAVIEKLFGNPRTKFLQARSVTNGCYTFRMERA